MPKPKAGMTEKKLKAAEMWGHNVPVKEIAEKLGVSTDAVYLWGNQDDFCDAILAASDKYLAKCIPKAIGKLQEQMDSKDWLSQGASNSLLRERAQRKGTAAAQVVVSFSDALPTPGMPDDQ